MPRTGLTIQQIQEKATEAAEMRIRKYGFQKVRLVDIAADLGVSHAALYNHFPDKSDLLDSASIKWLKTLEGTLAKVNTAKKSSTQQIVDWFIRLHRITREKALRDPELFKAFAFAAGANKPFVREHLKIRRSQLNALVLKALKKNEIYGKSAKRVTELFLEATIAFHHPQIVSENVKVKREDLLQSILETILKALS